MARPKSIQGVLGNFLGTYTSRYSSYDGYWLFGHLVAELTELSVDLLGSPAGEPRGVLEVTVATAIARFAEQLHKAGLDRSLIQEARLSIRRDTESVMGAIMGRPVRGYIVHFRATAVMSGGRSHERKQAVFVAPLDPALVALLHSL